MKSLATILKKHKTFSLSILFLVAFSITVSYATPPAQPFNPGQTLDPSCAPGETNCTVSIPVSPWTVTGNNISYVAGNVGIGTSSPSVPLEVSGQIKSNDLNVAGVGSVTTVGVPSNLQATIVYGEPDSSIPSFGAGHNYRVYAFKEITGGGRVYSPFYATLSANIVDDGASGSYSIHLSWNAVPGADGYKILGLVHAFGSDLSYYNYSVESSTNSYVEDSFSPFLGTGGDNVVTPTMDGAYTNTPVINGNTTFTGDNMYVGSNTILGTLSATGDATLSSNLLLTGSIYDATAKRLGIGTVAPQMQLEINGGGGILATGTGDALPDQGAGERMSWDPSKSAFRAGTVSGTNWDGVNVGHFSVAFGADTIASGQASSAFGIQTHATGSQSIALGQSTTASGFASLAGGTSTSAGGNSSFASGDSTNASGDYSFTTGNSTTASGDQSFAFGQGGTASGFASFAGGTSTSAGGSDSFAVGNTTNASGDYSFTTGNSTIASGESSTALGQITTASGTFSFAGGNTSLAYGNASFSFGQNNDAHGDRSIALGQSAHATGAISTAIGESTTASANASAAFNQGTTASGAYSSAFGQNTMASGVSSAAFGSVTTASSYGSFTVGTYNVGGGNALSWIATDPLFEVGNGTSGSHHDAFAVLKNGNTSTGGDLYVAGNLTCGGSCGSQWNTVTGGINYAGGKVGIGTATPSAMLDIEGDGAIIAAGTDAAGIAVPDLGAGNRMVWIPSNGSFRAGSVDSDQWDSANVGLYSTAFGISTIASNFGSAAFGSHTQATGYSSFAFGSYSNATGDRAIAGSAGANAIGDYSIALGFGATASGSHAVALGGTYATASGADATAFGHQTIASGDTSTAFGFLTTAPTLNSFSIGSYNVGNTGNATSWIGTDALFEIGNGLDNTHLHNALTVLKNGNVGISTATPGVLLSVGEASVPTGNIAHFETAAGTCNLDPTFVGGLTCTSDMNAKKNITNLADSSAWNFNTNIAANNQSIFDKVVALQPVQYNFKVEADGTVKHIGFIAQDVEQIFPDLVDTNTDGKKTLNYTGLIPYTVEAIREMNMNVVGIGDLSKTNTWRDSITAWLGSATNGIGNIFSKQVTTPTLCVGTNDSRTCITKDQLDHLLQQNGAVSSTGSGESSAPVDEQTPAVSEPSAASDSSSTQSEQVAPPAIADPAPVTDSAAE